MFIYKISNSINSKEYVGLDSGSTSECKRWKDHNYRYKTSNMAIHKAMQKYGIDNFSMEILEVCNSLEDLVEKEKYWIAHLDSLKTGYNATAGGQYQPYNSDETRRRKSMATTAYNNIRWKTADRKKHSKKVSDSISLQERKRRSYRTKQRWNNAEIRASLLSSMSLKAKEPHRIELSKKNLAGINNNKLWRLTSPHGEVYVTHNLPIFCAEHELNYPCMTAVARRLLKNLNTSGHQGWLCEFIL